MNALMKPSDMPLTMTSREIAELTGKEHAHVMRDIRAMMEALSTNPDLDSCAESTTYTGKDGRQYPQYELDKDTCLTLLLGYDAVARMKVVKRWQELEAGAAPSLNMRDPRQMAMAALQLIEVNQELQATIDQQQHKIAADAPKVEGFDRIASSDGSGLRRVRAYCGRLQVQEGAGDWVAVNDAVRFVGKVCRVLKSRPRHFFMPEVAA